MRLVTIRVIKGTASLHEAAIFCAQARSVKCEGCEKELERFNNTSVAKEWDEAQGCGMPTWCPSRLRLCLRCCLQPGLVCAETLTADDGVGMLVAHCGLLNGESVYVETVDVAEENMQRERLMKCSSSRGRKSKL